MITAPSFRTEEELQKFLLTEYLKPFETRPISEESENLEKGRAQVKTAKKVKQVTCCTFKKASFVTLAAAGGALGLGLEFKAYRLISLEEQVVLRWDFVSFFFWSAA